MGVGQGTKQLQGFLECTKTYEATVLFGAATDTYDTLGKILKKADYTHLTREKVEDALGRFRGKFMQRPPIFSALRVYGKRLYEYAREGKEVPKEIEKRPVEVSNLEVVEWLDGGTHSYEWPQEETKEEIKDLADTVLHHDGVLADSASVHTSRSNNAKRKLSLGDGEDDSVCNKKPNLERQTEEPEALMSGGLQSRDVSPLADQTTSRDDQDPALPSPASPTSEKGPPAVRLRMTVTSGFYVRSLSHDLGEAVSSLACMSELVRTRQGQFEIGNNVLEYEELAKGEEVWGPQVERLFEQWREREDRDDDSRTLKATGEKEIED